MPTPHRQVRHLRLRVARRNHADTAQVLLADALRTASLGDEGRVLIVRSLALGRLPLRSAAATWSLRLEERVRTARLQAVPADTPAADRAEIVYFPNHSAIWIRLALRAALGQPCTQWYWAPAAPGWRPDLATPAVLRLAFQQLRNGGGLPATLTLAHQLREVRALERLLSALAPADVAPLFQPPPLRVRRPTAAKASHFLDTEPPRLPLPRSAEWMRPHLLRWGAEDPRAWWLLAVAIAGADATAPLPTASELSRAVETLLASAAPETAPAPPAAVETGMPPRDARIEKPPRPGPDEFETLGKRPDLFGERLVTGAGGLFFLAPLLMRYGFGDWAAAHPAAANAGLPWQILRLALRHARTDPDDDLFRLLPEPSPRLAPGLAWRPLLGAQRLSRRLTGISLHELIVRPALVSLTDTHVDVFFRLREADVRIRRAALDLDPGWLPWLRRVVSFHYTRED